MKNLLKCVGEYKLPSILCPLAVMAEVILEVCIPLLMSSIIDVGLPAGTIERKYNFLNLFTISGSSQINFIMKVGGIMIIMAMCSLFFGVISGRFAAVAGQGLAKNMRKQLFNKVQDFSFKNTDNFQTGSLITRLSTDVNNVQMSYMMSIRMLVRAPFMLIIACSFAFAINKQLALVFFIIVPFLAGSLVLIALKAYPLFSKMFKKYDNMNSNVQENLVSIRVVKAFSREEHEIEKFKKASDSVRHSQVMAEKLFIFTMPLMQFTMFAGIIAIIYFGGNLVLNKQMESGELGSFIIYVQQILVSLMMISFVMVTIVMSKASFKRISEIFAEKIDIENTNTSDKKVENGNIVFENVDFSYSSNKDNLTLENISFEIKSGERIGIVGGTGAGKTTLVQLIPRLYDILDGKITVGGMDIKEYSLTELRNSVAMVLQKNVLFSGSIKENLLWGDLNASDEEIIHAAKAAEAHDFITSFPNGYETHLEQGGVNVSGGQKQRICIARALLKKPKIIILDDSTSAVDTATEANIRKQLKEEFNDITVITIAQRISSIENCDKIFVLDDGKINAIGTHNSLLKENKIYKEIYNSQH